MRRQDNSKVISRGKRVGGNVEALILDRVWTQYRVDYFDVRPKPVETAGNFNGWRFTIISDVRLVGQPDDQNAAARYRLADIVEHLRDSINHV